LAKWNISTTGGNNVTDWNFNSIPDQSGRVAVVTGANTGIGFETAKVLAIKGADVVLACRNPDKAAEAARRIKALSPKGSVKVQPLDLSDLDSVAAFSDQVLRDLTRLDLLINNAGVMIPPFGRTQQGFELQFGTNHLGHFALTGRLLPLLLASPGARIVVVSSAVANSARIAFDNLNWEGRTYRPWEAYGQSKLANLIFAMELQQRLTGADAKLQVTAAHPGWTATDLQRSSWIIRALNPLLAMNASDGALPTLRAATDPDASGGSYWGPSGFQELRGRPVPARIPKRAIDRDVAARLWDVSELLTGVRFAIPSPGV
jgi:NAD(P)-dependent dehydrogenase (short-subunit alcohol dehydrogenase family)